MEWHPRHPYQATIPVKSINYQSFTVDAMEGTTPGDDNGKGAAGGQDKSEPHGTVSSLSENGNQDNPGRPEDVSAEGKVEQHDIEAQDTIPFPELKDTREAYDDGAYSVSSAGKRNPVHSKVESKDMLMHGALQDYLEEFEDMEISKPADFNLRPYVSGYSVQRWVEEKDPDNPEDNAEWVAAPKTPPLDLEPLELPEPHRRRLTSSKLKDHLGLPHDAANPKPLRSRVLSDSHGKEISTEGSIISALSRGRPARRNDSAIPVVTNFVEMPFDDVPRLATSEQRRLVRGAICVSCHAHRSVRVSRLEDGTV